MERRGGIGGVVSSVHSESGFMLDATHGIAHGTFSWVHPHGDCGVDRN